MVMGNNLNLNDLGWFEDYMFDMDGLDWRKNSVYVVK